MSRSCTFLQQFTIATVISVLFNVWSITTLFNSLHKIWSFIIFIARVALLVFVIFDGKQLLVVWQCIKCKHVKQVSLVYITYIIRSPRVVCHQYVYISYIVRPPRVSCRQCIQFQGQVYSNCASSSVGKFLWELWSFYTFTTQF